MQKDVIHTHFVSVRNAETQRSPFPLNVVPSYVITVNLLKLIIAMLFNIVISLDQIEYVTYQIYIPMISEKSSKRSS